MLRRRAPDGGPWTLKEILQGQPLGHPSHVLLVHYPVALAPAVVALDLLARAAGGDAGIVRAATYLAAAAVVLAILAAVPGLIDWWGMLPGSPKRRVGTIHLAVQTLTIALLAMTTALRWPAGDAPVASWGATAAAALATVSVLVGNYFGGELVYRMGMRVGTGVRRE